jgi:hypothetical protein
VLCVLMDGYGSSSLLDDCKSGPRRKKGLGYRGSICVVALVVVFGRKGARCRMKFVG